MRLSIFVLFLGVVVVATAENHFLSDEYINEINNKQNTWTAGRNFDENTPVSQIRRLLGVKKEYKSTLKRKSVEINPWDNLPDNFDARENWPQCSSIMNIIRDQSTCGSCWAVAAVSAMSDRICIASNGTTQVSLSANDVLSCCGVVCGGGCDGGFSSGAWAYWESDGIVSGGAYGSNEGCKTYSFPPCDHVTPTGTRPPCGESQPTPKCTRKCDANSTLEYRQDLHFGENPFLIGGDMRKIQREIYLRGPVEASFDVMADFLNYKSGIYLSTSSEYLGGHAVKLLGWGEENKVPYWLAANTWNEDWGDHGFFKIHRGNNECNIENWVTGGDPIV